MNSRAFPEYEARLAQILDQFKAESSDKSVSSIEALQRLIEQAEQDIPGVLPKFDPDAMRGRWRAPFGRYDLSLLGSWIEGARARLAAPAKTIAKPPVAADLIFVSDNVLRKYLEADFAELVAAHGAGCLKSTIILCGSSIEALLVDALIQKAPNHPDAAGTAALLKWGLEKLIDRAIEWQLISPAAAAFSHSVREYRNLVHPGRVVREGLSVNEEEARIAIDVLNIVCRDLGARHQQAPA